MCQWNGENFYTRIGEIPMDWEDYAAIGGFPLPAIGKWLGHAFHSPNPAQAGMPYLQQIPGELSPMFEPYIHAGQQELGPLGRAYQNLMQHPGQLESRLGQGFRASPGYQYNVNQALEAANRAAAAGGMAGSPAEQEAITRQAHGLADQDYGNYMNRMLGMYGQGLQGMQGLARMGLGAGQEYGTDLGNLGMTEAQLAYAGQQQQNQAHRGLLGSLLGAGAGLLGSLF